MRQTFRRGDEAFRRPLLAALPRSLPAEWVPRKRPFQGDVLEGAYGEEPRRVALN